MAFVYIPCKDKEEARKVAKLLLEKKLIACANMFPIESMYWWNDKIEESSEQVILGKTRKSRYHEIVEEVKKVHSYEMPSVSLIKSKVNEECKDWLKGIVKKEECCEDNEQKCCKKETTDKKPNEESSKPTQ